MKTKQPQTTGVVTWQDTRGGHVDICNDCATRYRDRGDWPRNSVGEQYHAVSHGLHSGVCDFCLPREDS